MTPEPTPVSTARPMGAMPTVAQRGFEWSPRAKVFQVLGSGPTVRLEGLQRDLLMELLVLGPDQEDRREFINASRWGEEPSLEIDLRTQAQ